MEESDTYQAIIEKGLDQGLRKGLARGKTLGERAIILRLGTRRLGAPDAKTLRTINAIKTTAKLEALSERILSAKSWRELLA